MARIALLLLALVACKRQHAGPVASGPARDARAISDDAAAAIAPPVATRVDLLHAVPARVAVSSLVKNPKITPFHLVDGSMDTAWNSKTGDLKGAWIAFRVPAAAHITEIEMTAGFASTGDEGDYFTLNPRIKHVVLYRNGTKLLEKDLELARRDLQSIPIGNEGGDYKIEVASVEPGAKKNWRETCVSELRVIGTAPGMISGHFAPEMTIGSLDASPLEDPTLNLVPPKSYASIKDYCAELALDSTRTLNSCGDKLDAPFDLPSPLPAGWTAHWFAEDTSLKVSKVRMSGCNLALETKGRFFVIPGFDGRCGRGHENMQRIQDHVEPSRGQAKLLDVAGSADGDLVIASSNDTVEMLTICVPTTIGAPACGQVQIAELTFHNDSGTAGWNEWYEYKWDHGYTFEDDSLANMPGSLYFGPDTPAKPVRILE